MLCFFILTYTSSASDLSAQTRSAPKEFNPHLQRSLLNNPTTKVNNHETIDSFGIVEQDPYFNKIQNDLDPARDQVNSIYTAAGRNVLVHIKVNG